MPTTKITVVSTTVTREADDGSWKLREVVATDAQGFPIDKKLKTFSDLPLNQLIDVEVTQNERDKKYDEYLIVLPGQKKGGGGGGGGSGGLGRSVDLLREQVEALNRKVLALEGRMDAATTAAAGATSPAPAPASAVAGPADDDIPF